jgi:hypothetical protein
VVGGRPARDGLRGLSSEGLPGNAGRVSPPRPGQHALPEPRRWHVRGCHPRGARGDGALGVVLPRPRFQQRRMAGPLHRERLRHER